MLVEELSKLVSDSKEYHRKVKEDTIQKYLNVITQRLLSEAKTGSTSVFIPTGADSTSKLAKDMGYPFIHGSEDYINPIIDHFKAQGVQVEFEEGFFEFRWG